MEEGAKRDGGEIKERWRKDQREMEESSKRAPTLLEERSQKDTRKPEERLQLEQRV